MKKIKLFMSFLAVALIFAAGIGTNAQNKPTVRENYPDGKFPPPVFMDTPADSCAGSGLEQHDGPIHGNGYTAFTDSVRMVILFHPSSYPWTYTNVCMAFTRTAAGPTSHLYDIVVYDTLGSGGAPGNILQVIPGNTVSNIGIYPQYTWNSTAVTINVSSSLKAVYIGYRYVNSSTQAFYCTVDEQASTPLWPGFYATNITFPATWQTIQTVAGFGAYKCMAIRTQGNLATVPCPHFYASLWCPTATLPVVPGGGSIYTACAWVGDTLFAQCPDPTGAATTIIQRYSLSGNTWSTGVPLPVAKVQGTLTNCNGKLYYIGGGATAGDGGSNTVYEYSAGAWNLRTPLPGNVSGHAACNWGDSVIITVCGPWSAPTTACYFFRPASNTVGTSTPFGGAARRSHAFGIVGNKIFIACGFPFTGDFWIGTIGSNASTITWAAGPTPPGVPRSRIGGVGICDKFYLIGGNNSIGPVSSDSTEVYNINGNTWTVIPNKPTPSHNISASVIARAVGDTAKIYVVGGTNNTTNTAAFEVIGCGGNVLGIETNGGVPKTYTLAQNYPNPFNPSTNIKFGLPKSGIVKLVIFDLLGREVTTLINGFKDAGSYTVNFDASSLASGVYFYRIEANEFTQTKKMLLIK